VLGDDLLGDRIMPCGVDPDELHFHVGRLEPLARSNRLRSGTKASMMNAPWGSRCAATLASLPV